MEPVDSADDARQHVNDPVVAPNVFDLVDESPTEVALGPRLCVGRQHDCRPHHPHRERRTRVVSQECLDRSRDTGVSSEIGDERVAAGPEDCCGSHRARTPHRGDDPEEQHESSQRATRRVTRSRSELRAARWCSLADIAAIGAGITGTGTAIEDKASETTGRASRTQKAAVSMSERNDAEARAATRTAASDASRTSVTFAISDSSVMTSSFRCERGRSRRAAHRAPRPSTAPA